MKQSAHDPQSCAYQINECVCELFFLLTQRIAINATTCATFNSISLLNGVSETGLAPAPNFLDRPLKPTCILFHHSDKKFCMIE